MDPRPTDTGDTMTTSQMASLLRADMARVDAAGAAHAEQERIRTEREEAARLAAIAAEHASRLERARTQLDRAIADVKRHRGRADVEASYRAAKAAVVELETGDRPSWAPVDGG